MSSQRLQAKRRHALVIHETVGMFLEGSLAAVAPNTIVAIATHRGRATGVANVRFRVGPKTRVDK